MITPILVLWINTLPVCLFVCLCVWDIIFKMNRFWLIIIVGLGIWHVLLRSWKCSWMNYRFSYFSHTTFQNNTCPAILLNHLKQSLSLKKKIKKKRTRTRTRKEKKRKEKKRKKKIDRPIYKDHWFVSPLYQRPWLYSDLLPLTKNYFEHCTYKFIIGLSHLKRKGNPNQKVSMFCALSHNYQYPFFEKKNVIALEVNCLKNWKMSLFK